MNNKNLAFLGAGVLVAGLFTPIVTMPIVGDVNLFNNGTNLIGIDLLLLAALAALLAAKDRLRDVMWPGIGASGILLYEFGALQIRLSHLRDSVAKELEGNPFAGIAQGAVSAIQLQWGWLVLALGAGLLVYAAISTPRDEETPSVNLRDGTSRGVAGLSLLLLLFAPAWDLFNRSPNTSTNVTKTDAAPLNTNTANAASSATSAGPTAEEAAYVQNNLRLYDLRAKYFDSVLDGRVPGVDFKIQNNGNRTLNKVAVRVVFYDAAGNAISEEEYTPVLVSEYSIGDNTPLRPHYIWQQESGQFYAAKNVPSEWAEGKASATVTEIEFAPGT